MKAITRLVVMVVLFSAASTPAPAGRGAWHTIALDKTHVVSVISDPAWPSTLYATTPRGLFRSLDDGNTWSNFGDTLPQDFPPSTIAITPCNSKELYVGYDGLGVFKSVDSGQSWQAVNEGLPNLSVRSVAINCIDPNFVYLGMRGGLAISTNGGKSWRMSSGFKREVTVNTIMIDSYYPKVLYAGTGDAGVFKSGDGGVSWKDTNEGLSNLHITALHIDPQRPNIVLAGARHPATPTNVSDGKASGGVFRTQDGGKTWQGSSLLNIHIFSFAADLAFPNVVYASTGGGIYRSVDKGLSWTDINTGLDNTFPHAIHVLPVNPPIVLAGTTFGLLSYTDASLNIPEQGSDGSATTPVVYGIVGGGGLGLLLGLLWLLLRRKRDIPDSQQPVW